MEEIACVRDYLISRYEDMWKSHEDALVRFCAQSFEAVDSPCDYGRFEHDGKLIPQSTSVCKES